MFVVLEDIVPQQREMLMSRTLVPLDLDSKNDLQVHTESETFSSPRIWVQLLPFGTTHTWNTWDFKSAAQHSVMAM